MYNIKNLILYKRKLHFYISQNYIPKLYPTRCSLHRSRRISPLKKNVTVLQPRTSTAAVPQEESAENRAAAATPDAPGTVSSVYRLRIPGGLTRARAFHLRESECVYTCIYRADFDFGGRGVFCSPGLRVCCTRFFSFFSDRDYVLAEGLKGSVY